ncbi:MAG: CRISPR system precrRNA processing endoribonuclease RAMP protein Cas6 [Thermoanaerobaculum sp.]|nr:CRISPR system precrRNA processing endoribonuclease RAMP protein Cas6 [Thermoanaerobaculum sp.]
MDPWLEFLQLPVQITHWYLASELGPLTENRWWGSTVRGAVGSTLRFLLCRCRAVQHQPQCEFARFFAPENITAAGPKFLPPPWALSARVQGSELEVELRLFRQAVPVEVLSTAVAAAAIRGFGQTRLRLVRWHHSSTTLGALAAAHPSPRPVLRLESPTRLQEDGALIQQAPSFSQIFAAAQRRARLCARAWLGVTLPQPAYEHWVWARSVPVEAAEVSWLEQLRYSRRQNQLMRLGGLVGWVRYGGEWRWAWPWLRLAPILGLGKLTTMGLGEVRWEDWEGQP